VVSRRHHRAPSTASATGQRTRPPAPPWPPASLDGHQDQADEHGQADEHDGTTGIVAAFAAAITATRTGA
jgi:hypothetical protein